MVEVIQQRRALIVGPGAIGLCLARHFAEQGADRGGEGPFVLGRTPLGETPSGKTFSGEMMPSRAIVRTGGAARIAFGIRDGEDDAEVAHYAVSAASWEVLPAPDAVDVVFVCVKSTALERLDWARLAALGRPLAVLCNGYVDDLLEDVRDRFGLQGQLIEQASVYLGAKRLRDGTVVESVHPRKVLLSNSWADVASRLSSPAEGAIRFECSGDMPTALAKKWIINAAVNSLCAKYDLATNGELLGHQEELDGLIDEAIGLAKLLYPGLDATQIHREMVYEIIEQTENNMNSMVADLRRHQPTESRYLAGLALGHAEFPRLAAIHRAIEARHETPGGS